MGEPKFLLKHFIMCPPKLTLDWPAWIWGGKSGP